MLHRVAVVPVKTSINALIEKSLEKEFLNINVIKRAILSHKSTIQHVLTLNAIYKKYLNGDKITAQELDDAFTLCGTIEEIDDSEKINMAKSQISAYEDVITEENKQLIQFKLKLAIAIDSLHQLVKKFNSEHYCCQLDSTQTVEEIYWNWSMNKPNSKICEKFSCDLKKKIDNS